MIAWCNTCKNESGQKARLTPICCGGSCYLMRCQWCGFEVKADLGESLDPVIDWDGLWDETPKMILYSDERAWT